MGSYTNDFILARFDEYEKDPTTFGRIKYSQDSREISIIVPANMEIRTAMIRLSILQADLSNSESVEVPQDVERTYVIVAVSTFYAGKNSSSTTSGKITIEAARKSWRYSYDNTGGLTAQEARKYFDQDLKKAIAGLLSPGAEGQWSQDR